MCAGDGFFKPPKLVDGGGGGLLGAGEEIITIDDPRHPLNDGSGDSPISGFLQGQVETPMRDFDIHSHADLDQRLLDAIDPEGEWQ